MNKILFIVGPTATGKTKLGIELARKYNGEVISADSRQVYKGMDIGTGKDLKEYDNVKYWGVDLCEPDYDFNVSEYRKYALEKINDIQKRDKLPIIVGGTGFYIKALLNPWETIDIKPNNKLRQKLSGFSVTQLQKELQKVNKNKWNSMNTSDRQNPRRLIRAIETASSRHSGRSPESIVADVLIIGLTAPYKYLYERIDRRVDDRIKNGVEKEKKRLIKKYKKLPKTLGYGSQTVQEWKFAEHNYTRRQMTYFEHQFPQINWFDIRQENLIQKIEDVIGDYLK